nr:ATP synthase F0 subunit 8 [Ammianus toi]
MPQMAPMWWTTIYLMTIIMLMITMIMMFFNKKYSMEMNNIKTNQLKNKNWKW